MTFRLALTRRGGLPTAAAELKCWATRGLQTILEVAILNVRVGLEREFEAAFAQASLIIASMPGNISHQLQRWIETSNRYALLVNWRCRSYLPGRLHVAATIAIGSNATAS
jgi:hypothetical protein